MTMVGLRLLEPLCCIHEALGSNHITADEDNDNKPIKVVLLRARILAQWSSGFDPNVSATKMRTVVKAGVGYHIQHISVSSADSRYMGRKVLFG